MSNPVKFFSKKEGKIVEGRLIRSNDRTVILEIDGKYIKKRYNQLEKQ